MLFSPRGYEESLAKRFIASCVAYELLDPVPVWQRMKEPNIWLYVKPDIAKLPTLRRWGV